MDNPSESVSDETDISNFPSTNTWSSNQSAPNASNSTLLFIAVEYVKEGNGNDYKFETDSSFSPQPSSYSEFDQHVSPLDPNMSCTARYSPVYSDSVENTYTNSVVVLQDAVNPLISTENTGTGYINNTANQSSYHLTNPASPLESINSPLSSSDNNLLRQVVGNRFLQMVTNTSELEVEDATCGSPNSTVGNINMDYTQRSATDDTQIMDKELQLVQFPMTGYQHQLSMVERNMKVDPDQVELLITDQNTGISYSGYVSQDFLVSRNTPLSTLPEDDQQLNNVLNTLQSHGLVMETQDEADLNEVTAQSTPLALSDGQIMLQDPLLDSDLLLHAPVEIALDDSVLSTTNGLVLKSDTVANALSTSNSANPGPGSGLNMAPGCEMMAGKFDMVNVKEENIDFDEVCIKTEFEAQQLRRSRRQNDKHSEDGQLLNRIQTISDKPVPSRARATLPASYLVINKLPAVSTDAEPEYGVFARKVIPKRTQFGPLDGVLLETVLSASMAEYSGEVNGLKLLLESESGSMHRLDISDENRSNWMRFVRPACNYNDQNLVLSQQGYSLYYTTTRAILPRQELQVGYCAAYAVKRKLTALQPTAEDESSWPCFECPLRFTSSDELQKHLNVHDENKDDVLKPRVKKIGRYKRRPIDCPQCSRSFLRKYSLSRHLQQHKNPTFRERMIRRIRRGNVCTEIIDKHLEWKCDICGLYFPNPSLLNLHELVHKNEEETITGLPLDLGSGCNEGEFLVHNGAVQCPQCGIEYSNRKLLIEHVAEHGKKDTTVVASTETVEQLVPKKNHKCYMCYKAFASRDRLQRHMLVHGSEDLKPLKCDTCSKRFLNNSALSCHLKTHKLDKKIFECPICKTSFDQILQLKEHVRSHCIEGQYTCPHCNKIFKEYSIIRKHIRAFHCDRKHGCQYCGKPFPTLDKLRMHLLKHSDHREFLCSECGKQFKRKDKLKEHIKRMHTGDREPRFTPPTKVAKSNNSMKKFMPKVQPTDYHRFIYKCHSCLLGFKRRGMLVNHLAKRHPDISPESVPELNLPILKTTRDYYCQYCEKVYKSSSKRKAHILKNHPGAELPMSNRRKGGIPDIPGLPNPTYSQTVGSVTTNPHGCQWCHKQYASKAKLLQHQRKKHQELLPTSQKQPRAGKSHYQIQHQPQSPGIPEEGKYMNSPDIPDSAMVDSTVLADDISEGQLNVLVSSAYIQCEDTKTGITAANIKQAYKLTEDTLLTQPVDDFDVECRTGQYYRLIQMPTGHISISQSPAEESIDDPPESSRLYRLLTANGPFPPYPPR
ncbi:uncharacterized protein CBL_09798 [Carabus blaptoides fortunei]